MEMRPGSSRILVDFDAFIVSQFDTNKTRLGYATRYVPTTVKVYPNTDVIEEYGSRLSLDKYGVVVVSGEDRLKLNNAVTISTRGFEFRKG